MNLNLDSGMFIVYIFMACLGICYLVVRIMYSGPIKISEHGTKKYIITIMTIIIVSAFLTLVIAIKCNIGINIKELFNT